MFQIFVIIDRLNKFLDPPPPPTKKIQRVIEKLIESAEVSLMVHSLYCMYKYIRTDRAAAINQ